MFPTSEGDRGKLARWDFVGQRLGRVRRQCGNILRYCWQRQRHCNSPSRFRQWELGRQGEGDDGAWLGSSVLASCTCECGKGCKFEHPLLPDRAERCWICSAKDHRKAECPVKDSGEARALGGSGGGNGNEKGGKNGKGKGKTKTKSPTKPETTETALKAVSGSSTTATTASSNKNTDQGEEDGQTGTGPSSSADSGEALIAEATHLLKSIRPKVNAVRLQRLDTRGESTMLLDGGATHCLRCAKDEEEWQAAEVTTVQLAAGSIQLLRQDRDSGTLLTMDRSVQPIIPLADLTRIGVEISWSTDRCRMVRADGRVLPTHLDGGCPVISKREGEKLMQEIEAYHRHRCGMRVYAYTDATRGEGLCGDEDAKRCLEMKALFPNIPAHIAERVPGAVDFDVNKIPFNRRQGRRSWKHLRWSYMCLVANKHGYGQRWRRTDWSSCASSWRKGQIS